MPDQSALLPMFGDPHTKTNPPLSRRINPNNAPNLSTATENQHSIPSDLNSNQGATETFK